MIAIYYNEETNKEMFPDVLETVKRESISEYITAR